MKKISKTSISNIHKMIILAVFWIFIASIIAFSLYMVYNYFNINNSAAINSTIKDYTISKEEFIQYQINKNIFNHLIKLSPIFLALFGGIFGLFTYITNQNLKESEKIVEKVQLNSISYENKYKEFVDIYQENTKGLYERFYHDINKIATRPSEVIQEIMVLFNGILDEDKQLEINEMSYLLDLMDLDKASKACWFLGEKGTKNSLQFMKKYLSVYRASMNPSTFQLEEAIKNIEARC